LLLLSDEEGSRARLGLWRSRPSLALGAVPSRAQDITIGEGIALGWGQFFVADHDKTWEKQGLIPKVSTFASGRLVLDALVGGDVLIGTAVEKPVVFATLNGLPVRIIATMNRHEPFDLVGDGSKIFLIA